MHLRNRPWLVCLRRCLSDLIALGGRVACWRPRKYTFGSHVSGVSIWKMSIDDGNGTERGTCVSTAMRVWLHVVTCNSGNIFGAVGEGEVERKRSRCNLA